MANTASPLVLDTPPSAARTNTRRKPETPRQPGNLLRIRIGRNGQQPATAEGGAFSSPPQQLQQQDQQGQHQQQQQQAMQPQQGQPDAPAQQLQQQLAPVAPAAAADADGDIIVIDSDSDDDDVVVTGVTLPKKRPRQVLQQQQQPRALQQPQQQRGGLPAMPTWDPPVVPQRERSPEPAFKCLICLDGIKADSMATTPCGHMFCFECICDAVRATKKCPKCRKSTTLKQIKRLYPN